MVDGIETTRVGQQFVSDGTNEVGQDQIDDLPLISYVIVCRHDLFELFADRRGDSFHEP